MFVDNALLFLVTALVIRWFRTKDPESIFNVYRRPNRWYPIKYIIAFAILAIRRFYVRWGLHRYIGLRKIIDSTSAGYGIKSKDDITEMDKLQTLPNDSPMAVDAVFFVGASKNGYFFTAAIARRPNDIANAFWHLKIPNVGLLLSPKQPETTLRADPDAFSAEGLHIEPVEPMRLWRIEYQGQMRLDGPEDRMLRVSMQLEWRSELPYFDFDTDMDWRLVSRAIAREPWSREYFDNLKRNHQTHYEQMGYLQGTVKIEGFGEHYLDMNSMRDHSYARNRDWKLLHRYALHNVTVNDGTKFAVGIVSHPDMFSALELGYLYTPAGKLISIESCDLELFRHGEQGTPSMDYAFTFRADGKDYYVQCQVLETVEMYMGANWEGRLLERMCRYRVNGKLAWGFSEWEYRHHGGKPIKYNKSEDSSFDTSFEAISEENSES